MVTSSRPDLTGTASIHRLCSTPPNRTDASLGPAREGPAKVIFHLPSIAEHDYPAFRRASSNNLPETYFEWLELTDRQIKDLLGRGHSVRPVGINAAEFIRYGEKHVASAGALDVYEFAAKMASGGRY